MTKIINPKKHLNFSVGAKRASPLQRLRKLTQMKIREIREILLNP
jgi:hypothetical protein